MFKLINCTSPTEISETFYFTAYSCIVCIIHHGRLNIISSEHFLSNKEL